MDIGESFGMLSRQPTKELFEPRDRIAFTFEAACPDESGAIVDHVHYIFPSQPVRFKWAGKVYMPLRTPVGCSWLSRFRVRGSIERRFMTFFTKLVTFVTHRDVPEFPTAHQCIRHGP